MVLLVLNTYNSVKKFNESAEVVSLFFTSEPQQKAMVHLFCVSVSSLIKRKRAKFLCSRGAIEGILDCKLARIVHQDKKAPPRVINTFQASLISVRCLCCRLAQDTEVSAAVPLKAFIFAFAFPLVYSFYLLCAASVTMTTISS